MPQKAISLASAAFSFYLSRDTILRPHTNTKAKAMRVPMSRAADIPVLAKTMVSSSIE